MGMHRWGALGLAVGSLMLCACSSASKATATIPPEPSATASATPLPPSAAPTDLDPYRVWIAPSLPPELRAAAAQALSALGGGFAAAESAADSDLRVEPGGERILTDWVYAAAAAFPTVEDELSAEALRRAWMGGEGFTLLLAQESASALEWLWGPQTDAGRVETMPQTDLLERAWQLRSSRALIPFHRLEPRWKVLRVNGVSPLDPEFDPGGYALSIPFGLSGDPDAMRLFADALAWPSSNRDPAQMTVLLMSGVSALVRGTARQMDLHGATYPGAQIADWLRDADLAHISHEVAFATDCPAPDPHSSSLRFCSRPEYLQLFDSLEIDLLELTGNHLLDWGPEALLYTLDQYAQRGWQTFGGGADLAQALQPALVEHNGNRLAFLGCNAAGPPEDWAGSDSPGAAPCDEQALYPQLGALRQSGYLPVFTYQWPESASASPLPQQVQAFRAAIDAGAVVVSGSQAHRPQAMEFYGEGFIHFGLGNLFFDQMEQLATRQEFLDGYVFYQGRLISIQLHTALLENYSQPRPMTPTERQDLLQEIFQVSGW